MILGVSQSALSATHAYCSRESNQVITVFIRVTTAQLGLKSVDGPLSNATAL